MMSHLSKLIIVRRLAVDRRTDRQTQEKGFMHSLKHFTFLYKKRNCFLIEFLLFLSYNCFTKFINLFIFTANATAQRCRVESRK